MTVCANFDSELGASGGVKPKAETTSIMRMRVKSKNPSGEKNQYWTVYIDGRKGALYTKSKEGSDQEMADLWEEGN